MIRNIFWQVDGGLFDTRPAITYAVSKALNEMGYAIALNVIDGLVHQSLEHCLGTLSQRFRLDPGLLHRQFTESYLTISPDRQTPFPGAVQVCEFIMQHDGMNIAITQLELESAWRLLDAHKFSHYFGDIFPDDVIALRKNSLRSNETLLVTAYTDSLQTNIHTCLLGENLNQVKADFRIRKYGELLVYLSEQNKGDTDESKGTKTNCV